MTTSENSQLPKLVIAIDFGTFSSGYALQWLADYTQDKSYIYAPPSWGSHLQRKLPTCILLKKDKSVHSFGRKAERAFYMMPHSDRENYYFFKHFKLRLYDSHNEDERMAEGAMGKTLPLDLVISKSIEFLKSEALNYLKKSNAHYENIEEDIKWVLTVPAIWVDPAKSVMRKAAEKAGIKRQQLTIALEPECAAIYCKMISQNQFEYFGTDGRVKKAGQPGSVVMVIDIGGGTVDVATLKVRQDGTMEHVRSSSGGQWGGQVVDENFMLMMRDIVGQDVLEKFGTDFEIDLFDLEMEFEMEKRNVETADDAAFIVKFPNSLATLWEEKVGGGKTVYDIINSRQDLKDRGVKLNDGRLIFSQKDIQKLFDEPVKKIVEFVRDTRKKVNTNGIEIDSVIAVGGFAMSSYMIESLRHHLNSLNIPVVRPFETELAVLYGAVLFGRNESIISSRVMQHTYGIGFTMEFDTEKHDEAHKYKLGNDVMANRVFRKHVTIDSTVPLDKWFSLKEYWPDSRDQTKAQICIFVSQEENPIHTTDSTCVGSFEISFPDGDSLEGRAVEISMCCSGTELNFKAESKKDGKIVYHKL